VAKCSREELLEIFEYSSRSLGITEEEIFEFTRCIRPNGTTYGTGGRCVKGTETTALDVLQSGIKGRVPRNDPSNPLATGSTPLEKAKQKLKLFEKVISDPNRTPSDTELERFGKLKLAVQEFENKKEGRKRNLFGKPDDSDLDESKSRRIGKEMRKLFPKGEDRQTVVRALQIHRKHLTKPEPLLRKRSKGSTEEILKLERGHLAVSETLAQLNALIKRLPRRMDHSVRIRLENYQKTLVKAESSYAKAIERLSKAPTPTPEKAKPKGEPKYHRDGTVTYHY
jgi:hypothetical protein